LPRNINRKMVIPAYNTDYNQSYTAGRNVSDIKKQGVIGIFPYKVLLLELAHTCKSV